MILTKFLVFTRSFLYSVHERLNGIPSFSSLCTTIPIRVHHLSACEPHLVPYIHFLVWFHGFHKNFGFNMILYKYISQNLMNVLEMLEKSITVFLILVISKKFLIFPILKIPPFFPWKSLYFLPIIPWTSVTNMFLLNSQIMQL